jgi:hypothetical protein
MPFNLIGQILIWRTIASSSNKCPPLAGSTCKVGACLPNGTVGRVGTLLENAISSVVGRMPTLILPLRPSHWEFYPSVLRTPPQG